MSCETQQTFALVAHLGEDVPNCFQRTVNDTECFRGYGAVEIHIEDNDHSKLAKNMLNDVA